MNDEQKDELLSLECIYQDDIAIRKDNERAHLVFVTVVQKPSDSSKEVCVTVEFGIEKQYPSVIPLVKITRLVGLSHSYSTILKDLLEKESLKFIGSCMIFNLLTCLQEWLDDYEQSAQPSSLSEKKEFEKRSTSLNNPEDSLSAEMNEDEDDIERDEDDLILIGHGTPMTEASFSTWLKKHKAEEIARSVKPSPNHSRGLTGRQMFERDVALVSSDLSITAPDEENVIIDESLFERVDDAFLHDLNTE